MKDKYTLLTCSQNNCTYRIEEDNPAIGWYIYVFDKKGKCINDHLQETKEMAFRFCQEKYNIHEDKWEIKYT